MVGDALDKVKDIVDNREGGRQVISNIAEFWSTYLGIQVDKTDVCAMMSLLKIARISSQNLHEDSWVDLIGYGYLGSKEVERNKEGRID